MARKTTRRTGSKSRTNSRTKSRRTARKTSRASDLTSLAYKMGQVQRGLQNPDSKISSAYDRGKTKPARRKKQSLF